MKYPLNLDVDLSIESPAGKIIIRNNDTNDISLEFEQGKKFRTFVQQQSKKDSLQNLRGLQQVADQTGLTFRLLVAQKELAQIAPNSNKVVNWESVTWQWILMQVKR